MKKTLLLPLFDISFSAIWFQFFIISLNTIVSAVGISAYLISFQLCSAGDIIDGKNLDMVMACLEYLLESSSL